MTTVLGTQAAKKQQGSTPWAPLLCPSSLWASKSRQETQYLIFHPQIWCHIQDQANRGFIEVHLPWEGTTAWGCSPLILLPFPTLSRGQQSPKRRIRHLGALPGLWFWDLRSFPWLWWRGGPRGRRRHALTLFSPSGASGSVIHDPNREPEVLIVMGSLIPVSLPQAGKRVQGW